MNSQDYLLSRLTPQFKQSLRGTLLVLLLLLGLLHFLSDANKAGISSGAAQSSIALGSLHLLLTNKMTIVQIFLADNNIVKLITSVTVVKVTASALLGMDVMSTSIFWASAISAAEESPFLKTPARRGKMTNLAL